MRPEDARKALKLSASSKYGTFGEARKREDAMIYEYVCEDCGREVDRRASLEERDRQNCALDIGGASCGGRLRRIEIPKTADMGLQWAEWRTRGGGVDRP